MERTEVARGSAVKKVLLESKDGLRYFEILCLGVLVGDFHVCLVFIFDAGTHCFVWVGKGASTQERKKGMEYAHVRCLIILLVAAVTTFIDMSVISSLSEPSHNAN